MSTKKFCFQQLSKCDPFSASIFQGLFKNIIFRSVAFFHKQVMGYNSFFLHRHDF